MKDNKTEKLMNEITKAFDMLRGSLHMSEAFKIVFVLLHYKRFNDIIKNCEGFNHCIDFIPSDEILPEEYRWQHLNEVSADQIFTQIDTSLYNIYSFNNTERFGGTGKPLNIQKYQSKIPQTTQKNLLDIFNSHDLSLKGLTHKEFETVVRGLETNYIKVESKELRNKISYAPPSLSKLIVKLLNFYAEERVYIPFCGFGNIFIAAIDHAYADTQSFGPYEIDIYLNERNEELLALLELKFSTTVVSNALTIQQLYYPSRNPEILLFNIQYLSQPSSEASLISLRNRDQTSKADVIFLQPPFGFRQLEKLPAKVSIDGNLLEINQGHGILKELLFSLQKLSTNGRMSVVLPIEILSGKGKIKNILKFLIDNDYVEAVIQLPENIFLFESIQTILLVLKKDKPKPRKYKYLFTKVKPASKRDTVFISDEEADRVVNTYKNFKSKEGIDEIVTLEDVQQQEYNLTPELYISAFSNKLKKLIENKEAFYLGEISTIGIGNSRIPYKSNDNTLPFITVKNLARDVTEPYLDLDTVSKRSQAICLINSNQIDTSALNKKSILVSLAGHDLQPTIFDPDYRHEGSSETEILLGENIAAIMPNEEKVDFEYLYYQLYSPIVKRQINTVFNSTDRTPDIHLLKLKDIVIPVPGALKDQRIFVEQQKLSLFEIENRKLEAIKARLDISVKKQEAEYEIVRHLAHGIKPKINIVKSPIMTICDFLDKNSLLDKEVSTRLDGTQVTARDAIKTALENLGQITNVLDSARNIVTREIRKDEFLKTKIFVLFENKIKPSYENKPYKIIIESKDKEIEASLHVETFIEAINNIIRNAEMHAFSDDIVEPELRFKIHEDKDEEEILIDYTNNGHPFPSSMSEDEFISFGKKSIDSEGEGLGGAWIGKVIDAHGGSFKIIRDNNPVHFRITFPKGV